MKDYVIFKRSHTNGILPLTPSIHPSSTHPRHAFLNKHTLSEPVLLFVAHQPGPCRINTLKFIVFLFIYLFRLNRVIRSPRIWLPIMLSRCFLSAWLSDPDTIHPPQYPHLPADCPSHPFNIQRANRVELFNCPQSLCQCHNKSMAQS